MTALSHDMIPLLGAGIVGVAGGLCDLRRCRRIPNVLTFPAFFAGLTVSTVAGGWRGLVSASAASLIAFSISVLFFAAHAMGGGDVKLLTAVAAFLGMPFVFPQLICTALIGGILGLVVAVREGRLLATISNIGLILSHHLNEGLRPHPTINIDNPELRRVPYGAAIALATIVMFFAGR